MDLRPQHVAQLCEGGEPIEAFTIPQVHTRCPEAPGKITLVGDLAFTDKGVCFLQMAEGVKADASAGVLFGAIGQAIAESSARRKTDQAYAQGHDMIAAGTTGLMDKLNRCLRLIHYPAADVTDVGMSWWSGFYIKTGKKTHIFKLRGGRKLYKQFRPQIEAYLNVIGSAENVNPYAQSS